jgi:superfamily II DNA/RNA helicase
LPSIIKNYFTHQNVITSPTPIQAQSWVLGMSGYNFIATAKTGRYRSLR